MHDLLEQGQAELGNGNLVIFYRAESYECETVGTSTLPYLSRSSDSSID